MVPEELRHQNTDAKQSNNDQRKLLQLYFKFSMLKGKILLKFMWGFKLDISYPKDNHQDRNILSKNLRETEHQKRPWQLSDASACNMMPLLTVILSRSHKNGLGNQSRRFCLTHLTSWSYPPRFSPFRTMMHHYMAGKRIITDNDLVGHVRDRKIMRIPFSYCDNWNNAVHWSTAEYVGINSAAWESQTIKNLNSWLLKFFSRSLFNPV